MKFKFRLDKVLKHREIEEDMAKRDFSIAVKEKDDAENVLNNMLNRKTEIFKARFELERNRGNNFEIEEIDRYQRLNELRIKAQKEKLDELNNVLEEKRLFLLEKSKDKKMIIKLKEREYERFRLAQSKKAAKEQDEFVTQRYKRGIE